MSIYTYTWMRISDTLRTRVSYKNTFDFTVYTYDEFYFEERSKIFIHLLFRNFFNHSYRDTHTNGNNTKQNNVFFV